MKPPVVPPCAECKVAISVVAVVCDNSGVYSVQEEFPPTFCQVCARDVLRRNTKVDSKTAS